MGELDAARAQLWEQLLAGELDRVSVTCNIDAIDVYKYIPHSLGLERIWPHAYQQDRKTGVWRTRAEFERIARDLAAGSGWICGSGWMTWDPYFIRNAQVVLIFQSPSRRARMYLSAGRSSTAAGVRNFFRVLLRRRARFDDGPDFAPRRRQPVRGFYSGPGQYALDNFPEKTFVIHRREDLKKLRSI